MKTSFMTPVALLAVLSGFAGTREDAVSDALPELPASPACFPTDADDGGRYDAVIFRHAQRRRLNPRLVKAIIAAESQFTPAAVSRCGARGLMQVMPATAEELGIKASDLSDPETNISAGTEYLALLFKAARHRSGRGDSRQAREVERVIAAYHSGPGVLDAEVWSEPTRRYVRTVLNCYGSAAGAVRTPRGAETVIASR